MFLAVDVISSQCLGQKVDVLVVNVIKIDVLELVQLGRPGLSKSAP
jgi:hypothetical protein